MNRELEEKRDGGAVPSSGSTAGNALGTPKETPRETPTRERVEGWIAIGLASGSIAIHVGVLAYALYAGHCWIALWCVVKILIAVLLLITGDRMEKSATMRKRAELVKQAVRDFGETTILGNGYAPTPEMTDEDTADTGMAADADTPTDMNGARAD